MENECEALPGVAYPGVRDNRSTINTKTGYDEYDETDCKDGNMQPTIYYYYLLLVLTIATYFLLPTATTTINI